jgi:hypothetical protein
MPTPDRRGSAEAPLEQAQVLDPVHQRLGAHAELARRPHDPIIVEQIGGIRPSFSNPVGRHEKVRRKRVRIDLVWVGRRRAVGIAPELTIVMIVGM